jgi:eukaryotic-like serine/threonine-protein kinase
MQTPPPPIVVKGPVADVKPGMVIGGKYRVEREIGRGGFGLVVRAVHLQLHQPVAIKILTEGEGADVDWDQDAQRFRREAQATATLRGEHVVRILDVDALETGAPYIVMEYLEGQTLHHATHSRGPLSVREAVDIGVQTCAALAEAHAAGIVHRDLKPANVFLAKVAPGGTVVKVLDFGVSKMGGSGNSHALTRTGAVIGTVAYMAPEQMLDAKRVDGRADLWSVGQILYEALTKQLPFGPQAAPTLVNAILTKPATPITSLRADVPRELEAILMRCFEKEAERRFQTASELGLALGELASPASRPALEYLFRAPPPSGAAAPGVNPPARISRHTNPVPIHVRPRPKSIVPLVAAFAIGTVVLGTIALIVYMRTGGPRTGPVSTTTPAASFPPAPPIPASIAMPTATTPTAPQTTPVASATVAPAQSTKKPRK